MLLLGSSPRATCFKGHPPPTNSKRNTDTAKATKACQKDLARRSSFSPSLVTTRLKVVCESGCLLVASSLTTNLPSFHVPPTNLPTFHVVPTSRIRGTEVRHLAPRGRSAAPQGAAGHRTGHLANPNRNPARRAAPWPVAVLKGRGEVEDRPWRALHGHGTGGPRFFPPQMNRRPIHQGFRAVWNHPFADLGSHIKGTHGRGEGLQWG